MTNVYPLKCLIRNEATATRVDVYDDIGEGGWFSEGLTAKDFAGRIAAVQGALDVHINSAGGDCFDGVAIANAIRNYKGDSTTFADGIAASIASVIFQAGKKRIVEDGAMVMIHDAFGVCVGNESDMLAMAGTLGKVSDNIASIYADRSGKGTRDSWREEMRQERWYTADETVAAGLADSKGTGTAEIPPGLDLAAFTAVPGRIAARLREMPVAARPRAAAQDHGTAPEQTCAGLGHQCCKDAASAQDVLRGLVTAEVAARWDSAAALAGIPRLSAEMHGDHERWDPDGDGDCDACPEGDTDHDYWSGDGEQVRPVPGKPLPAEDRALTAEGIRAVVREELHVANAVADESAWDGPAAMSQALAQDDPAAAFRAICAGEKTAGEPGEAQHWALPHHKHAGDPPNRKGVSSALGYLDDTKDLMNEDAARSHLEAHRSAIGGGGEDHGDAGISDLSGLDLGQLRAALKGATA